MIFISICRRRFLSSCSLVLSDRYTAGGVVFVTAVSRHPYWSLLIAAMILSMLLCTDCFAAAACGIIHRYCGQSSVVREDLDYTVPLCVVGFILFCQIVTAGGIVFVLVRQFREICYCCCSNYTVAPCTCLSRIISAVDVKSHNYNYKLGALRVVLGFSVVRPQDSLCLIRNLPPKLPRIWLGSW